MKEEKKEFPWITFGIIIILVLIFEIIFTNVNAEFEMDCNSGNIDIDYSGKWLNQTEFLNEFIKLNNIDGLNCKIKGKVDMPWWLALIR